MPKTWSEAALAQHRELYNNGAYVKDECNWECGHQCPICEETVCAEPEICQVIADDMRVERRMVAIRDQSEDVFIADEMATTIIVEMGE